MENLTSVITRLDPDDVLAYQTKKVVIIRDRYLGALHIAGILGVFGYFIINEVILDQAYMVREQCRSVIETSLKSPSTLVPATSLSYCAGGTGGSSKILPCTTGPDVWVQAPSTGGDEMFIATRVKDVENGTESKYFVQDPESYTVGIAFTMSAQQSYHKTGDKKFTRTIANMETTLKDVEGNVMTGAIERISRFDVIKLSTIAKAAGLTDINSVRYKGTVLVMLIDCPMDRDGSVSKCTYIVRWLGKEAEAEKYIVTGIEAKGGSKNVQERRGIRLIVSSSGEMGRFKWSALMISWVASMGMLGIVVVGVDFLMAKVMPLRKEYSALKWERSPDFSDYRDGDSEAIARLESKLESQASMHHEDSKKSKSEKEETAPQSSTPNKWAPGDTPTPLTWVALESSEATKWPTRKMPDAPPGDNLQNQTVGKTSEEADSKAFLATE